MARKNAEEGTRPTADRVASVRFTGDQIQWLRLRAAEEEQSIAGVLRELVNAAMWRGAPPDPEDDPR